MQNINLDAAKLFPAVTPPNSPASSICSNESFVTAPSSPNFAEASEKSLSAQLRDALLDGEGLRHSTPPPSSPILYLNDDELFLPSLPPHLLEPPARSTDPFTDNDPRELPRPSYPRIHALEIERVISRLSISASSSSSDDFPNNAPRKPSGKSSGDSFLKDPLSPYYSQIDIADDVEEDDLDPREDKSPSEPAHESSSSIAELPTNRPSHTAPKPILKHKSS